MRGGPRWRLLPGRTQRERVCFRAAISAVSVSLVCRDSMPPWGPGARGAPAARHAAAAASGEAEGDRREGYSCVCVFYVSPRLRSGWRVRQTSLSWVLSNSLCASRAGFMHTTLGARANPTNDTPATAMTHTDTRLTTTKSEEVLFLSPPSLTNNLRTLLAEQHPRTRPARDTPSIHHTRGRSSPGTLPLCHYRA